jgi:dUTP pyrophosphatase
MADFMNMADSLANGEARPLLDIIEQIMALPEDSLNDTSVDVISGMMRGALTPKIKEESIKNVIRGFEDENLSRGQAAELVAQSKQALKDAIDEVEPSPNKRALLDAAFDFFYEVFDEAFEKYHSYAFELPIKLEDGGQAPTYAHETDAGLDIYAREEITIAPGETKIIGTGIRTAIPEGYAILIQPRSGQSVKTKLRIANTPGLIDSGYRDEIGVIIENIEPPFKDIDYEFDDNGEIHIKSILHGQSYTIAEGQRFAQMRLVQVPKAEFVQVESVGEIGEDRGGGFGSTGIG